MFMPEKQGELPRFQAVSNGDYEWAIEQVDEGRKLFRIRKGVNKEACHCVGDSAAVERCIADSIDLVIAVQRESTCEGEADLHYATLCCATERKKALDGEES